jgi:hypothetical protein
MFWYPSPDLWGRVPDSNLNIQTLLPRIIKKKTSNKPNLHKKHSRTWKYYLTQNWVINVQSEPISEVKFFLLTSGHYHKGLILFEMG